MTPNFDIHDCRQSIREVGERSNVSIYGGDCVTVAAAIQYVFGGRLVASYANEIDFQGGKPAHMAVEIDGRLYDGGGETSREALRDRAYYGGGSEEFDEIIVTEVPQPDWVIFDPWKSRRLAREIMNEVRPGDEK